jgi:leader peptidase (prepilin peptidase)/N-methyltransferase
MGYLLAIIIGWCGGIAVNYISDVLPAKRRLTKPVCMFCFETQPLKNYLFWPRFCSSCQHRRPWRVWAVEAVSVIASLWLWVSPPDRLGYWLGIVLLFFFGIVVVIDLEHRLILDPVSIVGAILSLGVGLSLHGWKSTLIGGAAGYLIMLLLYYFGELFSRWMARLRGERLSEVALGFGDVNLSGILGLLLGWPAVVVGLFLAIFLGGAFSILYILILLIIGRYQSFLAIPYGPCLVASAFLLLFLKSEILSVLP